MKTRQFILIFMTITALLLLLNSCTGSSNPLRVGETVANFSGTTLNNKTFTLSSHMGKPVIIRFFLLDCPYCRADTPIFNKFYEKYREQGLDIVYINNDGNNIDAVKNFVKELDIRFPVIFDPDGKIAKQYNVRIQPLTLVLSPEHKLLAALVSGVSEPELDELLGKYFQG
jgi:peroxiredoxin